MQRMGVIALIMTAVSCAGGDEPVTDDDTVTAVDSPCDVLDPSVCVLPFPSSHFLVEAETITGYQVNFADDALPENRDDVQVRPDAFNEKDGFSINSPALVWFDDVSLEGVIGHQNLEDYDATDAMTVIIDLTTGLRVPHFVELDATAPDADEALLILRPVTPLEWDTDYVVGLRGFQLKAGGAVQASPAFAALRDGDAYAEVENRRAQFDDVIFPALADQGFDQAELQIAWDFHTASRENTLGRMEWIRDDALDRVGDAGPPYTFDTCSADEVLNEGDERCFGRAEGDIKMEPDDWCDSPGRTIGRTLTGFMTVPLYTEDEEEPTFLTRDENNQPFYNGDTTADFMIRVPCSLITDPEPSPILQYGHGLLGDLGEMKSGYLGEIANENKWTMVATTWKGMSEEDADDITVMVVIDPSDFNMIAERSHQGLMEAHMGMRMMMGDMSTDDAMIIDGTAMIDPERRYYYGNSQGAIMGGAYLAMSPDITRGVLGVGGAPYSLLLPRSNDFDPFFKVFKEKFTDHREIMLFVAGLTQQLWDPAESGGWLHDMRRDAEEPNEVLLQVAIGDAQVTTLGAHIMARAYGAKMITPQTRPVWGIEEVEGGFTGAGFVEFEYSDIAPEPVESVPPDPETDPHECPRRDAAGRQQLATFLNTGIIEQYCDGRCVAVQETCR